MAGLEHEGRVAVVTGGGRGFGKAFGQALADAGATVVLADIDADAAREAAAGIGERAWGLACDVADAAQVEQMVAEVVSRQGGVDILINNAGLHSAAYSRPMEQMGLKAVRRLFDVNVMGVIGCSLATKNAMRGRANASIVNISSSASYNGVGTAYGVSKQAVRGLTATFAREFAADGIRVNAIAPGLIFTDTIRAELPPEQVQRVMAQQLLRREGSERDIVEALLYLVSERASFVTGETLRVSGGFALSV